MRPAPASASAERARFLDELLDRRLDEAARAWLAGALAELASREGESASEHLGALLSRASRALPRRGGLAPSAEERARARSLVPAWDPERWTLLETARVRLVLAHPDLAGPAEEGGSAERGVDGDEPGARALEQLFRFADVGELCALYRSFALLERPERFAWRAREGARSNMRAVFEAICCDSPYPLDHFDDLAWRQAVIKALFVGAPLWRVQGLDQRLDPELARMALDLADERHAAGRRVSPELLLCLGDHGGARALAWIERLFADGDREQRRAAALAFGRAGQSDRLRVLRATEGDALVAEAIDAALAGRHDQTAFAAPLAADRA